MANDLPGSYCQNCLTWNPGDRETCVKCGTRLLILAGDQTWEDEPEEAEGGEDLEEHLLERITGLEETLRRVETYLETVSDQLGKLERSEVMLRNGLMALVQEMEQKRQLDAHAFSERWEHLVEENLNLISARELFTRYRARILPIARPKSMSQLKRALLETTALLESADLPGAAQRLGQALPLDPKNYELIFTVASLHEAAQNFEEAESLARKAVGLSPRHFEAWMLLAKLLQELPERADQAIEAMHQAADLRPDDPEPRMMLAELLLEQEDLQGALEAAQEAVARRKDGETLLLLGQVHLARGESALAVPVLKDASAYLPGDLHVREALAEAYLLQDERPKAFAILHELLLQNPGDPQLLLMLDAETHSQLREARDGKPGTQTLLDEAETLLDEDQLESAALLLKRARRKGRSQRLEWLELRLAFLRQPEKTLKAALDFACSDRHPRLCFLALRLVLEHLMAQKREPEIARALDAFLTRHPKSSGAWEAALMRLAYRLMNGQVTEQDLVEVRRLHAHPLPGLEPRARTLLGQYLLALKHHQDVLDLLDPLLEKEPTLINHFQLGAALAGLGEREEARTLLKTGLEADPGDLNESQAKGVRSQIRGLMKELDEPPQP
ncbi:tetratricopeptide repeat protein [Geothrix sp.]|jgi:tetratricopeptide (TPR) repeat protein|uniref:tetratricopeptide repeat protein n=1 Tax=Geothrix sp. TaxID=1962974 RepID=UPI0025B89178|nr:tetratricopeptide repeat protein [Geothrix sp.]